MNPHPQRHFATEAVFVLASLCAGPALAAPTAGTVTQLSGPLFAQKADGRTKVLAGGSSVDVGDTLLTAGGTYAEVRFADRGIVTLQPDTRLAIEAFSFDPAQAQGDRAELTLVEGGIRVANGAIGARSPGRHTIRTTFGSIDVGQSTFIAQYSAPAPDAVAVRSPIHLAALSSSMLAGGTLSDISAGPLVVAQAAPRPPTPAGLPAGLYVSVINGAINLTNRGGSQAFTAGQFGYTANVTKPPIVVPTNPVMVFLPPPSFGITSGPGSASSTNKPATVDCEVR